MKFKITRPDGTIIEGEGTADDVLKLAPLPLVFSPVTVPSVWPAPCWPVPTVTYSTDSTG